MDEHDQERARQHFASGTLGAVKYIVGGLRGIPGRKSVILFSQNLPMQKPGASGGGDGLAEQTGGHPALRRFLHGQKVAYSYRILNPSKRVETELRLCRDGALVFHTPPKEVVSQGGPAGHKQMTGVLTLGPPLLTGNYVLQVVVTDRTGRKKRNVAAGWMDFELLLAPNLE